MSKNYPTIARYYDLLSGKYDDATKGAFKWTPPLEAFRLLKTVDLENRDVLDIGIGTGQVSELLQESGCHISGVDISEEMLKEVKRKFPNFYLYQSDLSEGLRELNGKVFDIVCAIGVLEFLSNFEGAVATIASSLKPSGYACFTIEEHISDHELQGDKVSETWKGSGLPKSELLDFFHYRRTTAEVLKVLKDLNLKLISHHRFEAYLKSERKIPIIYSIFLIKKN